MTILGRMDNRKEMCEIGKIILTVKLFNDDLSVSEFMRHKDKVL